ncbi:MAG: SufE family protein [Hyphomicrobiales bacterium]|nr:SufE family protein [Hyphomicrobiales bacterium]MDE2114573.1 SufE family protein [Hyphomicrobiales bacterium]
MNQTANLTEIIDNFAYLDDWEDRYRYIIELGKALPSMPAEACNDQNKVRGCASQVWLLTQIARPQGQAPVLTFTGDSDAHIVKGLVALILAMYSGHSAPEILDLDANELFATLGLAAHLTPQRTNGVRSMVERIKSEARAAMAAQAS